MDVKQYQIDFTTPPNCAGNRKYVIAVAKYVASSDLKAATAQYLLWFW